MIENDLDVYLSQSTFNGNELQEKMFVHALK